MFCFSNFKPTSHQMISSKFILNSKESDIITSQGLLITRILRLIWVQFVRGTFILPVFCLIWLQCVWLILQNLEDNFSFKNLLQIYDCFISLLGHIWLTLMIYLILKPCSGIQPPITTSFLWENTQHLAMIYFTAWFPGDHCGNKQCVYT